jgi:hypothetical protein
VNASPGATPPTGPSEALRIDTSGSGQIRPTFTVLEALLPVLALGSLDALTVAKLLISGHDASEVFTVIATVVLAPPTRSPTAHVTVWPVIEQPGALVIVTLEGSVSTILTSLAVPWPAFSAVIGR